MFRYISLVLLAALTACATTGARRRPAADSSTPATAQDRAAGEMAVYIGDMATQFWTSPNSSFNITSAQDPELTRLEEYLKSKMPDLGGQGGELRLTSVIAAADRTVVRFEEVIARHRGDQFNYEVPLAGSGLVVTLTNGQIASISSTLAVPPSFSFVFQQPGFDTSGFTTHEYKVLLGHVRESSKKKEVADTLARVAREAGVPFDLKQYLSQKPSAQRAQLGALLGHLNAFGTAKLLVEMAMKKRLQLVQRSNHWMLNVIGLFDLPVEFDMEIPEPGTQQHLKVRNLRELHQNIVVNIYDGKTFPAPPFPKLENTPTEKVFDDIADYHKNHHHWLGYDGHTADTPVEAILNMTAPEVIDNAAWTPKLKGFLIGTGSQLIHNQDRSYSVLGHEYTHAIVENSSQLIYNAQSGALNEHIADIEGSYIDGEKTMHQDFTYIIGAEVLLPNVGATQGALVGLLIKALNVPQDKIAKYNLDKVPLRHLRYPILSLTPSLPDMATAAQQKFGADCQPSTDNDQCGVHAMSGIPNAAVSAIIDTLGADRVNTMIFNTVTLRLNAHSTFKDYVRQMYEECQTTPGLDKAKDCPVVIKAFADVGVTFPTDTQPAPPVQQGPPPPRVDPLPAPKAYCGIVTKLPDGNVTVVDHKFDAAILVTKNDKLTTGNFQDVYQDTCACVMGNIDKTKNSNGVAFNYFAQVTQVKGLADSACNSLRTKTAGR